MRFLLLGRTFTLKSWMKEVYESLFEISYKRIYYEEEDERLKTKTTIAFTSS